MKTRTPPFYFIIQLVVYPFSIMVSVDEPDDILIKRLKKLNTGEPDLGTFIAMHGNGRAVMFPSNSTLIRLKLNSKIHNTIAHEVFHAVSFIMEKIGMRLSVETNDEAYAYAIGYVTEEIYKRLEL